MENDTKGKRGNPGYGYFSNIKSNLEKAAPRWWEEIMLALNGQDKDMKKFAMSELNKLQVKVIPTTLDTDNGALQIIIKRANDADEGNTTSQISGPSDIQQS